MRNYLLTIIILTYCSTFSTGQNLVSNHSFEDTISCPLGGQIQYSVGWFNFGDSPDLYHPCSSLSDFSVPNNWGGYQQPANGIAYVGLAIYESSSSAVPNSREFFGSQLSSNLIIGTKYFVSFYANLSLSPQIWVNCASNNLGAMFSTIPYSQTNPPPLNNNPQVNLNTLITDTINWTKISGSFIADSSYKYIIIGNFFSDSNTDTLIMDTNSYCNAYYFIDDICVSTDSLTCSPTNGISEPISISKFKIYPNPTNQLAILEFDNPNKENCILILSDICGHVVQIIKNITDDKVQIERGSLKSGLYFFNLHNDSQTLATGRLTIE